MSQKKIKVPKLGGAPVKKSFSIGIEDSKDGRRLISISPRGPVTPAEMLDGLIGALAATYINVWGSPSNVPGRPQMAPEDQLTPEQYCQMIVNKVMARLTNFKVQQSTIQ